MVGIRAGHLTKSKALQNIALFLIISIFIILLIPSVEAHCSNWHPWHRLDCLVVEAPAVAPPPPVYNPVGFHDSSSCDAITGWSCDPEDYAAPLEIHFYADGPSGTGTIIGTATANLPREAGVAASCGGNANHGFRFTTSADYDIIRDGQSHTIYAYAINIGATGSNILLPASPKSFICTPDTSEVTCTNLGGDFETDAAPNACCGDDSLPKISVRARGELCDGPPNMQIIADGEVVYNAPVSNTAYTTIETPPIASIQNIQVHFTNDFGKAGTSPTYTPI